MEIFQGMIKNIFFTVRYLTYKQILYRIKYKIYKPKRNKNLRNGKFVSLSLIRSIEKTNSLTINGELWNFKFLNLNFSFFHHEVDWSFDQYGMLWAYNLNYFDWLNQKNFSVDQGIKTLKSYYSKNKEKNTFILQPYAASIRIINISKFVTNYKLQHGWLYGEVINDLEFLNERLEFHLLANHLLENAFALFIGGLVTNREDFKTKGEILLTQELNEQILDDGMHYERSPMYHLIIHERLLDALNFAKAKNDKMQILLTDYAIKMTRFTMNWESLDNIPMMQDSTFHVSSDICSILKYSKRLLNARYPLSPLTPSTSGYRLLHADKFFLFANVGNINPTYQPGHSHADELNFELFYNGNPIIVDTGVSTYEKNQRRQFERSTLSHNCLSVNSMNSSDVWSGFRVGRRCNVSILKDGFELTAKHNGFRCCSILRTWKKQENNIIIKDVHIRKQLFVVNSKNVKGRLHIHPKYELKIINGNMIHVGEIIKLRFEWSSSYDKFWLENFEYCAGFNSTVLSKVIVYGCTDSVTIEISEI